MDRRVAQRLHERRLLPPERALDPAASGLVPDVGADLPGSFRGALLAGAVGDALGRPVEGRPREHITGRVTDFRPRHGWQSGPIGTVTDDTQLTMEVARSLVAGGGRLDPDDLAHRLVDWLPRGRGVGRATRAAVERLSDGVRWWEAGTPSAGNGAAMRAAPVGLACVRDPQAMRMQAALSAIPTHADPMAVVSAVVMAYAAAWCACRGPDADATELLGRIAAFAGDLPDPGQPDRRDDRPHPVPVRLVDRIAEVGDLLDACPGQAFDHFHNGAFVLESLPAALWCFLRSPRDVEEVLVTAASGGRDADTVASMAGNLAGAFNGEGHIPQRWLDELEYRDDLRALADELFELSGLGPSPTR